MPAQRCAQCGYLCAPFLFYCRECCEGPDKDVQPVHYCGNRCQDIDRERHRERYHNKVPNECEDYTAGYCSLGPECTKVHRKPPELRETPNKQRQQAVVLPTQSPTPTPPPPPPSMPVALPPPAQIHPLHPQLHPCHQPPHFQEQTPPPPPHGFFSVPVPHPAAMHMQQQHHHHQALFAAQLQMPPVMQGIHPHPPHPMAHMEPPAFHHHPGMPMGQQLPIMPGIQQLPPEIQHQMHQMHQMQQAFAQQQQQQQQHHTSPKEIRPFPPASSCSSNNSADPSSENTTVSSSSTSLPTEPSGSPSAEEHLLSPSFAGCVASSPEKKEGEEVSDENQVVHLVEQPQSQNGGAIPKRKLVALNESFKAVTLSDEVTPGGDAQRQCVSQTEDDTKEYAEQQNPSVVDEATKEACIAQAESDIQHEKSSANEVTPMEEEYSCGKAKSRLEMKREARRAKKAARKKEKLVLMGKMNGVESTDQSRRESVSLNEELAYNEKEIHASTDLESACSSVVPDAKTSTSSSPLTVPVVSFEGRHLTKREKKREERRILNILKKKEKQKQKVREECGKIDDLKTKAAAFYSEGNYLQSAIVYKQAYKLKNTDSSLLAGSRDCYLALGKVHSAIIDAQKAVDLEPESEALLTKLLHLQIMSGQTHKALETCSLFPKASAEFVSKERQRINDLCNKMSLIHRELSNDNHEEAWALVQSLERVCPHCPQWQLLKAECLLHKGQGEEAKQLLGKNVNHIKEEKFYPYILALVKYFTVDWWMSEEREGDLMKELENCKSINFRCNQKYECAMNIKSEFRYSLLLLKNGVKVQTKKVLTLCLSIDPSHILFLADVHHHLAETQETNEESLRHYDLAIRFHESKKSFLERGKILKSMRKFEQAQADFEKALKKDPHCETTRRLLNQTRRSITNMERMQSRRTDLYAALGVSQHATAEEISQAYHSKCKEYRKALETHRSRPKEEQDYFKSKLRVLNKAWKVLSDPRARGNYDRQLKRNSSSDVDSDISEEEFDFYHGDDHDDEEEEDQGRLEESSGGSGSRGSSSSRGAAARALTELMGVAGAMGEPYDAATASGYNENSAVYDLFQSFMEPMAPEKDEIALAKGSTSKTPSPSPPPTQSSRSRKQ